MARSAWADAEEGISGRTWKVEEDDKLRRHVEEKGLGRWPEAAACLPGPP